MKADSQNSLTRGDHCKAVVCKHIYTATYTDTTTKDVLSMIPVLRLYNKDQLDKPVIITKMVLNKTKWLLQFTGHSK
jgi:hypothetical protein